MNYLFTPCFVFVSILFALSKVNKKEKSVFLSLKLKKLWPFLCFQNLNAIFGPFFVCGFL